MLLAGTFRACVDLFRDLRALSTVILNRIVSISKRTPFRFTPPRGVLFYSRFDNDAVSSRLGRGNGLAEVTSKHLIARLKGEPTKYESPHWYSAQRHHQASSCRALEESDGKCETRDYVTETLVRNENSTRPIQHRWGLLDPLSIDSIPAKNEYPACETYHRTVAQGYQLSPPCRC